MFPQIFLEQTTHQCLEEDILEMGGGGGLGIRRITEWEIRYGHEKVDMFLQIFGWWILKLH